jgi:hypothetical protein
MLTLKSVRSVYVGWESYTDESKIVSRAWFRERAEPWRLGSGVRLRIGHRAIQVGRCHPNPEPDMDVYKQLGVRNLEFDPAEIGAWRGPGTSEPPPAS